MILTCVIVDDEYLAIKILEDYVKHNDQLHLLRTFRYPKEALQYLQQHHTDLLFLDIQMPEMDGFGVLSQLENPPMVIFTTARPDYAVRAYELSVLDYLLKPISVPRFEKAVQKAVEYAGYSKLTSTDSEPDYMMINADFQVHKIRFSDILLIEGLSEYVKIHCLSGKSYITLASLKSMEIKLEKFAFKRIHKSFIINKNHIKSFTHSDITLINEKIIPIGRVFRKEVFDELSHSV